jgi:hypothetical protein
MDLYDLWKCHICRHAEYLFLVVPKNLPHTPKAFERVHTRLSYFFDPGRPKNYVNVGAVFLFGY